MQRLLGNICKIAQIRGSQLNQTMLPETSVCNRQPYNMKNVVIHCSVMERNFLDQTTHYPAVVNSGGGVRWHMPLLLKSSCHLDVRYFPYDLQACKLIFRFGSFHNQLTARPEGLFSACSRNCSDLGSDPPNVERQEPSRFWIPAERVPRHFRLAAQTFCLLFFGGR